MGHSICPSAGGVSCPVWDQVRHGAAGSSRRTGVQTGAAAACAQPLKGRAPVHLQLRVPEIISAQGHSIGVHWLPIVLVCCPV